MIFKRIENKIYKTIKKYTKGMSVVIIPSYKCNFKCYYCVRDVMEIKQKPDLGLEKWKEFLTDLNTNLKYGGTKVKEIILSGGEPTILPYFVELSEWILSNGWYLTIFTNLSNTRVMKIKKNRKLLVICSYHPTELKTETFKKRWERITHRKRAIELGSKLLDFAEHKEIRNEKFKMLYHGTITVDADFKMYNYNLME